MPIDFSPLERIDPAGAFFRGREAALAEQDRNALRQQQAQQLAMQQENALALREQRMALADERRAAAAKAAESQGWLSKVTALFESNNMPLNLQTARQGQLYAIRSGNKEAVEMMNKTVQALEEREALAAAFGPQTAAPGAAPAVAPAVAPTNALAAPPQAPAPAVAPAAGVSRERLQAIIADPNAPKAVVDRAKVLLTTLPPVVKPTPAETEEIVTRLQDPSLTPQARAALEARLRVLTTREPKEPREPALRTTKVELVDGSIGVMNLDTGEITPATVGGQPAKGKPSAFAEKTAAQRKQLSLDIDRTITELENAAKPKGLIEQSTGSGAGRLIDVGAAFVGQATPGAIAAGKLAPIADMVLKMVPRFEGPQSDKDTKSYKEAAGQLADTTLPTKIRQAAAIEIVRLMKARKGQFATQDMAAEGAAPAPAGGNFPAPPPAAIDALKRGQGTDAQFDAIFGPGAAARARGR